MSSSPCIPTNGIAANPVTGKYYVIGLEDSPAPIPHVVVYSGTTNKLLVDVSGETFPALAGADSITVDPLSNTIYVGSERGTNSAVLAAIDGNTNVVSAIPPTTEETNGYALAIDLGTHVLAAGGVDYTNLFFPTADLTSASAVPISVTMQGVSDGSTIATAPLFRTRQYAAQGCHQCHRQLHGPGGVDHTHDGLLSGRRLAGHLDYEVPQTGQEHHHGHGHRDHAEARCGASHSLRLCQYRRSGDDPERGVWAQFTRRWSDRCLCLHRRTVTQREIATAVPWGRPEIVLAR